MGFVLLSPTYGFFRAFRVFRGYPNKVKTYHEPM